MSCALPRSSLGPAAHCGREQPSSPAPVRRPSALTALRRSSGPLFLVLDACRPPGSAVRIRTGQTSAATMTWGWPGGRPRSGDGPYRFFAVFLAVFFLAPLLAAFFAIWSSLGVGSLPQLRPHHNVWPELAPLIPDVDYGREKSPVKIYFRQKSKKLMARCLNMRRE
jgi:hypothetical protein